MCVWIYRDYFWKDLTFIGVTHPKHLSHLVNLWASVHFSNPQHLLKFQNVPCIEVAVPGPKGLLSTFQWPWPLPWGQNTHSNVSTALAAHLWTYISWPQVLGVPGVGLWLWYGQWLTVHPGVGPGKSQIKSVFAAERQLWHQHIWQRKHMDPSLISITEQHFRHVSENSATRGL